MVVVVERQPVRLTREQPAQHPAAQVQRDERFRAEQVERTAQQRAFGRVGDVIERGARDQPRVPLQPAHERVAVAELHRRRVFQATAARPAGGRTRRSRAGRKVPRAMTIAALATPSTILSNKSSSRSRCCVALTRCCRLERVAPLRRRAGRCRGVLLHRAQARQFIAQHLGFLHPADALQRAVGHVAQRLAVGFEVFHPVDARVLRRQERVAVRDDPAPPITACGCSRPRRGSNSSPPSTRRSMNKQQRLACRRAVLPAATGPARGRRRCARARIAASRCRNSASSECRMHSGRVGREGSVHADTSLQQIITKLRRQIRTYPDGMTHRCVADPLSAG